MEWLVTGSEGDELAGERGFPRKRACGCGGTLVGRGEQKAEEGGSRGKSARPLQKQSRLSKGSEFVGKHTVPMHTWKILSV